MIRLAVALFASDVEQLTLIATSLRRRNHVPASVLVAALCAAALGGCAPGYTKQGSTEFPVARTAHVARSEPRTAIPLPDRELLTPQPEPDCDFKTTGSDADDRQKLDYERQCYRHAESIARGRLRRLQESLGSTIKAIKRGE